MVLISCQTVSMCYTVQSPLDLVLQLFRNYMSRLHSIAFANFECVRATGSGQNFSHLEIESLSKVRFETRQWRRTIRRGIPFLFGNHLETIYKFSRWSFAFPKSSQKVSIFQNSRIVKHFEQFGCFGPGQNFSRTSFDFHRLMETINCQPVTINEQTIKPLISLRSVGRKQRLYQLFERELFFSGRSFIVRVEEEVLEPQLDGAVRRTSGARASREVASGASERGQQLIDFRLSEAFNFCFDKVLINGVAIQDNYLDARA